MRKRNWYTGQLVTEAQMDTAFTDVENSVWSANADFRFRGVLSGHAVTEDSPASMDVVISAGVSYTPEGKRCLSIGTTTLDCSVDVDSVSTNVVGVNSSKIISVFAVFDRTLTTPEYDVTNTLVYTIEEEACTFEVIQGNEVADPSVPTAPALRSDAVLLCDITLVSGQTTITNGDISTDRRQSLVVLTRADGSIIHNGTVEGAVQNVLDILENHIGGSADKHDAHDVEITVDTAVNWADGNDWCTTGTVAVDDAIETHVVSKLASTTTGASGGHRLGIAKSSYQSGASVPVLAAGALYARLESMRDAANIYSAALSSWPSGDSPANPAAPLNTQLAKLVQDLARSQSHTDQGVQRIGLRGNGFGLAAWQALGATSLMSLCTGLNSATGTHDGAAYIGAKASGALLAGTVRSHLDALDTRVTANTTAITNKVAVFEDAGDDGDATPAPFFSFSSSSYTTGVTLDVTSCQTGDVLVVEASLSGNGTFTNVARLRLQRVTGFGGGTPSSQDNISGAVRSISQPASSTTWVDAVLKGTVTVDQAGTVRIYVVGKAFTNTLDIRNYSITVQRIRP